MYQVAALLAPGPYRQQTVTRRSPHAPREGR